jgi:hypothetical protein
MVEQLRAKPGGAERRTRREYRARGGRTQPGMASSRGLVVGTSDAADPRVSRDTGGRRAGIWSPAYRRLDACRPSIVAGPEPTVTSGWTPCMVLARPVRPPDRRATTGHWVPDWVLAAICRAGQRTGSRARSRKSTDQQDFFDGETRTRTGDTTIFSRVLYQLSYLASGDDGSGRIRSPSDAE